ncbi:BREX-1 system adenine-specific DNA-methyltransferase PglX (plasmid) [Streptomyces sp. NBC_00390]
MAERVRVREIDDDEGQRLLRIIRRGTGSVVTWRRAQMVLEIAYTPTNSSWLNRIEAQFTALRYFTLDGTDHATHKEQGSMIRRYIIWRNRHADDQRLRAVVNRANVA